jgi:hypothetical protein
MQNYTKNFDRKSEAGWRIAIGLILNEALTVLVSCNDLLHHETYSVSHQRQRC